MWAWGEEKKVGNFEEGAVLEIAVCTVKPCMPY